MSLCFFEGQSTITITCGLAMAPALINALTIFTYIKNKDGKYGRFSTVTRAIV